MDAKTKEELFKLAFDYQKLEQENRTRWLQVEVVLDSLRKVFKDKSEDHVEGAIGICGGPIVAMLDAAAPHLIGSLDLLCHGLCILYAEKQTMAQAEASVKSDAAN
jgi:hypothetical protein